MSDAVPILIAVEGVAIVVAVTGIVAYRVLPRDPDLHAPGDLKSSHTHSIAR